MKILITGGAGFIGSNLTAHFAKNNEVTVFDSLEREGSEKNRAWLEECLHNNIYRSAYEFVQGEVSDAKLIEQLVKKADIVLHLAAQVAVTNSISNPRRDFKVNVVGTFNLLEAARKLKKPPLIVYSSTNKVYGMIGKDGLVEEKTRYIDKKHPLGILESQPLDFYSPYGCSKGAAEAYVRDYGRIYGLPTVVLRKSCVYGVHQFGTEDQGWVAHFARCALNNEPITIYGNGKQARDLLYIDDLVALYTRIINKWKTDKRKFRGEVFNIGGGVDNTVSLIELIAALEKILKKKINIKYSEWRPGDQKVYISDISKAGQILKWKPKISINYGLTKLINWIRKETNC
jgi:CDP-paratose 2-epimerase